jgi:acetyltransferase
MFFNPQSIAIVGASRNPRKAGYGILKNVIWSFSNSNRIYPVNPSADTILGLKCYRSVEEIPDKIELAILFITPKLIPEILDQCYHKSVKGVIIESAGFAEVGNEEIQNIIKRKGSEYKIRIWGGNCMGTVTDTLVTTFEPFNKETRLKGNVSIVGQSGYFGGAILLQLFSERKIGIRKACSIGNRIDVDENDLLLDFLADRETKVAVFYLEGFQNPRQFLRVAKKSDKPIICLIGGQSSIGKKAALSHTSSTAHGSPEFLSGLLRHSGIFQVEEFGDLFNVVEAFVKLPIPENNRLAIVTITGAGGVIGADIAAKFDIEVPELSQSLTENLQKIFPKWMPPKNPIDSWPAFELHGVDNALKRIIPIIFKSEEIDIIILMIACMSVSESFDPGIVKDMRQLYHKPIIVYLVGEDSIKSRWTEKIREDGGVVFNDIKTCIHVAELLYHYQRKLKVKSIKK